MWESRRVSVLMVLFTHMDTFWHQRTDSWLNSFRKCCDVIHVNTVLCNSCSSSLNDASYSRLWHGDSLSPEALCFRLFVPFSWTRYRKCLHSWHKRLNDSMTVCRDCMDCIWIIHLWIIVCCHGYNCQNQLYCPNVWTHTRNLTVCRFAHEVTDKQPNENNTG